MQLTKSKERVKQFGEVFTPPELVNLMLDKLPDDMWEPNKTFLEPCCGTGNFVLEIVRRKHAHGHSINDVLSTMYGCDIQQDNVDECRENYMCLLEQLYSIKRDQTMIDLINKNIRCENALTYDMEFK